MTYGTVKVWELVTENADGEIKRETFRTWEEATNAFRDTGDPAAVYAVQINGRRIETWKRGDS